MSDSNSVRYQALSLVHEFDLRILAHQLQHGIPLPAGIGADAPSPASTSGELTRWLALLDLAITPPMLRDALAAATQHNAAAALLQYFVRKIRHNDSDRDKADFIATWLYRNPPTPDAWAVQGVFAQALVAMLEIDELPPLADEYGQLIHEFSFIHDDVLDLRDFDELMDSGVMQRVRDIKASFGEAFYNPAVLARVAEYNCFFGRRFDELFHAAARQIKDFAQSVQEAGGSELTRVDENVMVKHLEDVKETEILSKDYRVAQESFQKVSRFKKAVDKQDKARRMQRPAIAFPGPAATPPPTTGPGPAIGAVASHDAGVIAAKIEDGKLHAMVETIRNFVRAADPAKSNVVPMRHGNFILSQSEVDAYRAEYAGETSFRADLANVYRLTAGVVARIEAEMFDYRLKESSAYLWKPHADALAHLVRTAQQVSAQALAVQLTAEKRGLLDKANAVFNSMGRLRQHVQSATELLSQVGTRGHDS